MIDFNKLRLVNKKTTIGNTNSPKYLFVFPVSAYTSEGNLKLDNEIQYLLNRIGNDIEPAETCFTTWIPRDDVKSDSILKEHMSYKRDITEEEREQLGYSKRKKIIEIAYIDELKERIEYIQPEKVLLFGESLAFEFFGTEWNEFDKKSKISSNHGTWFDWKGIKVMATYLMTETDTYYINQNFTRDLERFITIDPYSIALPEYHWFRKEPKIDFTGWQTYSDTRTVYLDIETESLDDVPLNEVTDTKGYIKSIGWKNGRMKQVHVLQNPSNQFIKTMLDEIEKNQLTVVGHNIKFDLFYMFVKAGRVYHFPVQDTMYAEYINSGRKFQSLKHLTVMLTDRLGNNGLKQGNGFDSLLYLAEDVITTELLYKHYSDLWNNFAYNLVCDLIIPTIEIQFNGMYISKQKLESLRESLTIESQNLIDELNQYTTKEINYNSPAQLADYLIDNGVKLTEKTTSGNYSTAVGVLEDINHPLTKTVLELRGIEKTISFVKDYLERIENNGENYIHPELDLMGAKTGRISSKRPNAQQVPNKWGYKRIFTSRFENGYIGLCDFSKAEIKVAAYQFNSINFAKAALQGDIYANVATLIYGREITKGMHEREVAKQLTLGLLYGGSANGLAYQSKGEITRKQAQIAFDMFYSTYPEIQKAIAKTRKLGVKNGYVKTLSGRTRDLLPEIADWGEKRAERQATNTPIQGMSSDLSLSVLLETYRSFKKAGLQSLIIMTVHDSIIFDIHPDEVEQVKQAIQEAYKNAFWNSPLAEIEEIAKILPITGDFIVANSWLEAEDKEYDKINDKPYHNPIFEFECSSHGDLN